MLDLWVIDIRRDPLYKMGLCGGNKGDLGRGKEMMINIQLTLNNEIQIKSESFLLID